MIWSIKIFSFSEIIGIILNSFFKIVIKVKMKLRTSFANAIIFITFSAEKGKLRLNYY